MKRLISLLTILLCLALTACDNNAIGSIVPGDGGTEPTDPGGNEEEPGVPRKLTPDSGDRQVKLRWNAPNPITGDAVAASAITGYEYQQSETSGEFDDMWISIPGGESTREVTISGLNSGTTYYFRMRAMSTQGAAPASPEVSALAYDGPTAEPGASPFVTIIPGDRQVMLSWAVPNTIGASVITGYEYQQSQTSGEFDDTWIPVSGGEGVREFVISDLIAGEAYYFRVRAVNTEGFGMPSTEVSASPSDGSTSQLDAPSGLMAVPGDRQVTLSWEASDTVGASPITGYEYQQSQISGEFHDTWILIPGGENARSIIVSGLTGGVTYYFRVRALNAEGMGFFAEMSTTPNHGVGAKPGAPTTLVAIPGDHQVVLNWGVPDAVGISAITGYEYQQSQTSDNFGNTWISVAGDSLQVTALGLISGITYYFRVRAVNSQGAGVASTEVVAIPNHGPTAQPGAPTDLRITPGDRSVTLSWEAPDTVGASPITGYEYQKSQTSGEFDDVWTEVSGGASTREVVILGLTGAIPYHFRIRAVNSQGSGDFTGMGAIAYEGSTPEPGAPTNLTATSGGNSVALSWDEVSAVGISVITRYEYQRSQTSDTFDDRWITVDGGTAAREVTVSGLKGAIAHYFRVRAVNNYGEGTASLEADAIAYDGPTAEPGAPRNLTATSGDRSLILNWEAPNVIGASAITGYKYQWSASPTFGSTWTTVSEDTREVTISGLAGATNYYFRVQAVNSYGEGAISPAVSGTSYDGLTAEPGVPRNLSALPGYGHVTLTWIFPNHRGASRITRYEYQQSTGDTFDDVWMTAASDGGVTIIQLIPRTTYYFRVRAVNNHGTGVVTSVISATVYDGFTAEPESPKNLMATSGDHLVRLNWNPPRTGASAITHYEYQQSETSGEFDDIWTRVSGGESAREITISGLTATTTYYFRMRAVNSHGNGAVSTEVSAVAYDGLTPEPGIPVNFAATSGDRSMTLTWAASPIGASVVTSYEYQQSETNGEFGNTWTRVSSSAREITIFGLTAITTYYFRIRAVNSHGNGAVSTEMSAVAYDGLTPEPGIPVNFAATSGDRLVTLTWGEPDTIGASAVTSYEYQQSETSGAFGDTWTEVFSSVREVTISGLTATATYYFRMRAVNNHGNGVVTAEASAVAYDGLTPEPGTPVNFAATSGDRLVTLTWGEPDTIGASAVTSYEYQQSETSGAFGDTWTEVSSSVREVTISGLTAATTYYFRMRAVNSHGNGAISAEREARPYTSQLGAPTDLTAVSGDHSVTLSWEAPSGDLNVIGYEYQWNQTSDGFGNTWTAVSSDVREVTVSGLTSTTHYYFRVRAINTQGSGIYAEVSAVAYDGLTPEPGEPGSLTVTSGDRSVTLNWEVPSAIGASSITGYEYQQSETSGGFDTTWTSVSGGAREITVSGLTAMTTYYFRVRAINDHGNGPASMEVNGIVYDGPTAEPGAPGNLTATSGDRSVTLNWGIPSAIGASSITGYEYQQSETSGGFGTTWTSVSGGAREVTVSDLTGATLYYFRVRAVNSHGNGLASVEVNAIAYDGPTVEPGAPVNLAATSGDRSVTLSWETPSAIGASAITGYEYQQSETSGAFDTTWTAVSGGSREITISGLIATAIYYFRVRAVNSHGNSLASVEVNAIVYDGSTAEPGVPVSLTATSGDHSVTLRWDAPSAIGASSITGYEYQQSEISGGFGTTWTAVLGGIREVIVSGLTGATLYYFRVRAVNSHGNGLASTEVNGIAYDGPTAEPGEPVNLTATSGDHSVTLNWEAPGTVGASAITGYEYQQSETSGAFGTTWTSVSGNTREVIVLGLTGVTLYYFRVRAVNSHENGLASTEVNGIAYDGPTAEPGEPVNLTATSGDRSVTLNWEAPGTVGASAITGYEYQQSETSGAFGTTWTTVSDGSLEVTISSLTGGTTYYFRVQAVNSHGEGTPSTEVDIIPYDGELGVPTDLAATSGDRSVTLNWDIPSTTGTLVITGYEYQWSETNDGFDNTWTEVPGGASAREMVISDLTGATTYYFRVRAMSTQSPGADSEVSAAAYDGSTAEPGEPVNLTALSGDRSVTLNWEAPHTMGASAITGYEYQQSETSGGFGNTWTPVSGGARAVVISDLTAMTTYYFRVRAINSHVGGRVSTEVSAVAYDGLIAEPGEPTNLRATFGDRSVTLNWEVPNTMGASAITGYEYQQSETSGAFDDTWTTMSGGVNSREVIVSGLTGGTAYYFRVRAVNSQGGGTPSTEVNATPYNGELGAPTALAGISGDRSVTLSWGVPSTIGTLAITGYEYQQREASDGFDGTWTAISGGAGTREVLISDLTGATTYYFRVRAVNTQSPGAHSEVSAPAYDGLTAGPGEPLSLVAISGDHSVTLNWAAPNTVGASPITGYEYQQSETSDDFGNTWTAVSGEASEVVVSSLTATTTYYFRVRAVNSHGNGAVSTEVSAVAYDGSTPEPGEPRSLTATSGDRSVTLNWEAPDAIGASALTGYEYQQSQTSNGLDDTWTEISIDTREVLISDLTGITTYYFRVRAVNAQGSGSYSEINAIAYDGPTAEPGEPIELVASPLDRRVRLSWNPPDTVGASAITHYQYQQSETSGDFGDTWTSVPGEAGAREVLIYGLNGETIYYFRVRAVNNQGDGASSPEVNVIPNDESGIDLAACSDPDTTDDALPGVGTEEDPFVLCSHAHLGLIGDTDTHADYSLSAHYAIGQDIDLNNEVFAPIEGTFIGTLDGRGERIMNLRMDRNGRVALFLHLGSGGMIKDLGIEGFNVKGSGRVASLVAVSSGTVSNCYGLDLDEATDVLGIFTSDYIGGLVGELQSGGRIISSYVRGHFGDGSGGGLARNYIGGLVGRQVGGDIVSSYATGDVRGTQGTDDVGGLVGGLSGGRIISSYATCNVRGSQHTDYAGGLVGHQSGGDITSSYATGSVRGDGGIIDFTGGLVGRRTGGSLTFSYATGYVHGGWNLGDQVGSLVGRQEGGSLVASYGFGGSSGGASNSVGSPPNGVSSASHLTQSSSGWPSNAWNFGDNSQAPALKYVDGHGDHDDDPNTASDYICTSTSGFWPPMDITCGTTLLPGQGR